MHQSSKVLAAEAAGDSILLHTDTWTYLSLNRTGAWIWDQLRQERSAGWLIDVAGVRFEAPAGAIEADVNEFVTKLIAMKFVIQ